MRTPWGISQHETKIADGIVVVSTASHGGIFVSDARLARIPENHQKYAQQWSGSRNWFEEDCAAACVVVAYPEFFTLAQIDEAQTILKAVLTSKI